MKYIDKNVPTKAPFTMINTGDWVVMMANNFQPLKDLLKFESQLTEYSKCVCIQWKVTQANNQLCLLPVVLAL